MIFHIALTPLALNYLNFKIFVSPPKLQLASRAGVLETVRIRRQGYPYRETFADFYRRVCRWGVYTM